MTLKLSQDHFRFFVAQSSSPSPFCGRTTNQQLLRGTEVSSRAVETVQVFARPLVSLVLPEKETCIRMQPLDLAVVSTNGDYTFAGIFRGTYAIKPSQEGFEFAPSSVQVQTQYDRDTVVPDMVRKPSS